MSAGWDEEVCAPKHYPHEILGAGEGGQVF